MNTAIYIRVSTTMQIDRDSLKVQEDMLRAYCKNNKFKVYKVYKDAGYSAKKDSNRPAFNELINDIKAKKIQLVLVTKIDRISRSLQDLLNFIHFFHENDVSFTSITQNIDTSGYMGRFTLNLLGTIAELEREVTAERVSEVMHHRASDGKWNGGVIPYGYTTQKRILNELVKSGKSNKRALSLATEQASQDKLLYIDSDEAEVVKHIFQTYNKTKSIRETTRQLNSAGYKTRTEKHWSSTSISRMLNNPTYIGKLTYGARVTDPKTGKLKKNTEDQDIIYEGLHEKIISDSVFELTQKILGSSSFKRTRANKIYLLSRLLKCGMCGTQMYGAVSKKANGKKYIYYKCSNSNVTDKRCRGFSVPGKKLDEFIIKTLMELSQNKTFLNDKKKMLEAVEKEAYPNGKTINKKIKELIAAEKELNSRRENLLDALETKTIEHKIFQERFKNIEELLQKNREMQAEAQDYAENADVKLFALKASFEEISSFGKNWDFLDIEGKSARLRAIVKEIIVTKEDVEICLFLDTPGGDREEESGDPSPDDDFSSNNGNKLQTTKVNLLNNNMLNTFSGFPVLSRKPARADTVPTPSENASVRQIRLSDICPVFPARSLTASIFTLTCQLSLTMTFPANGTGPTAKLWLRMSNWLDNGSNRGLRTQKSQLMPR